MSDQDINVKLTANSGDLKQGVEGGASTVEQSSSRMSDAMKKIGATSQEQMARVKAAFTEASTTARTQMSEMGSALITELGGMAGHFGGLIEAVGKSTIGLTALGVAAAAWAAHGAAEATAKMTESAMDLGRAMSTTTNKAQELLLALEDIGADQSELTGAAKGLSRQLRENEDDLNKLGLVTRDASGALRPMNELVLDGIDLLNQHKEGADRALAGQVIFGRGIDASSKLLLLNRDVVAEDAKAMEELGLQVGANAVKAWNEFDAASDRAGFSMKAITKAIGDQMMPVITDMINAFNSVIPAAITVVRGALGGLVTAFLAVKNGVVVLWETINAMVITVAEPIRALAVAVGQALTGNFTGAAETLKGVGGTISGAWENAMNNMVDSSTKAKDRIAALWSADTEAGDNGGAKGDKSFKDPKSKKGPKEPKEKQESKMPVYEAELENERLLATQKDALRGMEKAEEVKFWEEKLKLSDLSATDRAKIEHKLARARIDVLRQEAREAKAIEDERARAGMESQLKSVDAAKDAAQQRLQAGIIDQQQMLAMDAQFEEQKSAIKAQYLMSRKALLDPERDPVEYEKINQQILALEQQHQAAMNGIRLQSSLEAIKPLDSVFNAMQSGMSRAMEGMVTGTMNAKQALASIWAGMRQALIGELAKMMVAKVAAFAKERLLTMAGIGGDAAKAGTGAAAAVAPIPIVGPALAVAALAAVFGSAIAMQGKVPSARGGWTIPSGVNPMAQLHEEEMVLPKAESRVIQDLAQNGGAGGGMNVNISAVDARSVQRLFEENGAALAQSLQRQIRNFNTGGFNV
jgi:hypothetical protein